MLERTLAQWGAHRDLWIFAYASLIWRPDFEVHEHQPAHVHGWHRALKMWSRVNRGTPQRPGLVFALLSGGSCRGMVLRVERRQGEEVLHRLWDREMMTGVYDPKWLPCFTPRGPVEALAFTLSRRSPSYTGDLSDAQYRQIFARSRGRYGTTRDYALQTFESLKTRGIHDRALAKLLAHATMPEDD
jgi:cation transport protein ChaC